MTVYFFLVKLIKAFFFSKVDKLSSLFKSASFSFMNLDSNLFFSEKYFCMPDVIQGLLLSCSLFLETFFNEACLL